MPLPEGGPTPRDTGRPGSGPVFDRGTNPVDIPASGIVSSRIVREGPIGGPSIVSTGMRADHSPKSESKSLKVEPEVGTSGNPQDLGKNPLTPQEQQPLPQTGIYRGDSVEGRPEHERRVIEAYHNRTVREYDGSWKEYLGVAPFDTLLANQINTVKGRGQKEVTVVDLGGGNHQFARSFLSDPSVGETSRASLRDNPDMRVRIVSLTDARSPEEFLKAQELEPLEGTEPGALDNSQIKAEAVPYSVTTEQPLRTFYEETGIAKTDLTVSVGFMTYLQPTVFKEVLTDVLAHTPQGGEAVIVDYHTAGGRRLSVDGDTDAGAEPVFVPDIRTDDGTQTSTQQLREEAEDLLRDPEKNKEELIHMLARIREGLTAKGGLVVDINSAFAQLQDKSPGPHDFVRYMLDRVLPPSEERILANQTTAEKRTILEGLGDEVAYNQHGIIITKPTDNTQK